MELNATNKTEPKLAGRALPAELADVAFADINVTAAAVNMSVSWVYEEVRSGRAPQPVIREPRCSRWLVSDVRLWLIELARKAAANTQSAELMTARATKASTAAQAKRAAKAAATAQTTEPPTVRATKASVPAKEGSEGAPP